MCVGVMWSDLCVKRFGVCMWSDECVCGAMSVCGVEWCVECYLILCVRVIECKSDVKGVYKSIFDNSRNDSIV